MLDAPRAESRSELGSAIDWKTNSGEGGSPDMGADRDTSLIHCGSVSTGISSSWLRSCWSEGANPFLANRSEVLREAATCAIARIITRARSAREIFCAAFNLLTARVMRTLVWPAGALVRIGARTIV